MCIITGGLGATVGRYFSDTLSLSRASSAVVDTHELIQAAIEVRTLPTMASAVEGPHAAR